MTIFQPRKFKISTYEMDVPTLIDWAETELKEKAEEAIEGQGVITYGPWCQFSSCNTALRARFDFHKKFSRFELKSTHLLTDSEIEEVLSHVDDLVKWSNEIKEYATKVSLESGKEWEGYKLVITFWGYKNDEILFIIRAYNLSYKNHIFLKLNRLIQ